MLRWCCTAKTLEDAIACAGDMIAAAPLLVSRRRLLALLQPAQHQDECSGNARQCISMVLLVLGERMCAIVQPGKCTTHRCHRCSCHCSSIKYSIFHRQEAITVGKSKL